MSASEDLKNIAIVGASPNVSLFFSFRHPKLMNRRQAARKLTGQDAFIFAMGFMAMGKQTKLIDGAAKAGMKWILPTEYARDGLNQAMMDAVPLFHPKVDARNHVEELAETHEGLRWKGVATNPWMEFSIQRGLFGIDIASRSTTLYSDSGASNTSTLEQVGLGVSRLLSLPVSNPSDPRASLEYYAGNFVYISSFLITQGQLFQTIQRVTKTTEQYWKINQSTIQQLADKAKEAIKHGDIRAGADITYAMYMGQGTGGNYEDKAKADRKVLGLQTDGFEAAVQRAVEAGPAPNVF